MTKRESIFHKSAAVALNYRAIEQIGQTYHVVGKFSPGPPRWFVFGDGTLPNGTPGITIDDFLALLKPQIGFQQQGDKFPCVVQVPGHSMRRGQQSTAVAKDEVFWEESAARTPHPCFRRGTKEEPHESHGRRLTRQMKKSVRQYARCKTAERDIVRLFARLLGVAAGQNALPAFATGEALPIGLPEKLIDLIVRSSDTATVSLDGIEFNDDWLAKRAKGPVDNELQILIQAFRDAILGTQRKQYSRPQYLTKDKGQLRADELAQAIVAREPAIAERVQELRNARAKLRRIYANPTFLGLMFKEVFDSYYRLKPVLDLGADKDNQNAADKLVGEIFRGDRDCDGVAPPVKRLSVDDRRQFKAVLLAGFEDFIEAVLADAAQLQAQLNKLSAPLQQLVQETRSAPAKLELIRQLAGGNRKAFVASAKEIVVGVLLPVLLREPTTSITDWLDDWREAVERLYLTCILLNESTVDLVRSIGIDTLPLMDRLLPRLADRQTETETIIGKIVAGLLDVFADKEVHNRLLAGIQTLQEVGDSVRKLNMPIEPLALLHHSEHEKSSAEQTNRQVKLVVQQQIQQVIGTRVEELKANPQGIPAAIAQARANAHDDRTRLETEVDEILACVASASPQLSDAELIEQASKLVTSSVGRILTAFSRIQHLIFERYRERSDILVLQRGVEAMVLQQLMLEDREELAFGQQDSNLFPLLKGLVEHADDKLDLYEFIAHVPITTFFDAESLLGEGTVELRIALEQQGLRSLHRLADYYGEFRSIEFLLDQVRKTGGRLVVFDATADEYLQLIQEDAFGGPGYFAPDSLVMGVDPADAAPSLVPCATMLLSSAFQETSPENFIGNLSAFDFEQQGFTCDLAPLVISAGSFDPTKPAEWIARGKMLKDSARQAPTAVIIVGPELPLNPPGDCFPTVLDASVVWCAGLISDKVGLVSKRAPAVNGVPGFSAGRFIGMRSGLADLSESIRASNLPRSATADYAFMGDRYLQLVVLLATVGFYHGGQTQFKVADFLDSCHYDGSNAGATKFARSEFISQLLGLTPGSISLGKTFDSVVFGLNRKSLTHAGVEAACLTEYAWLATKLDKLKLTSPAPVAAATEAN